MYLKKYATETTIMFPLIDAGTSNLAGSGDYTYAAGDIKVSKDGGAAANCTNSPSVVAMGNGNYWKLVLTAAEMTAGQITVTISDAATKAIEDQVVMIQTYGEYSGSATPDVDTLVFADGVFRRSLGAVSESSPSTLPARSLLNAIRFLRNRWTVASGTLTVYKEDDATSAWTAALGTTPTADAITSSDPA
jgi:hypothetical protein